MTGRGRESRVAAAALVVAAALGALTTWLLTPDGESTGPTPPRFAAATQPPSSAGTSPGSLVAEIDSLRAIVELEMEKRGELEQEVAFLREVVAELSGEPGLDGARGSGAPASAAEGPGDAQPVAKGPAAAAPPPPSFDREGLLAAGVHGADIEALYQRWTQLEMDKLYLADEARREGWAGTGRFRRARRELQSAVREELGEDAWDQWLYATNQTNRVLVGDVLEASPGQRAGLRPGDQIVRYAGLRVHSVRDVRRLTAEGVVGEQVRVELLRGGNTLSVGVERGPIGVILKEQRRAP